MNKITKYFSILFKKKSVKNGAWLYLLQLFNTIVPMITMPYITRILGTAKYGVFSIALNIIGYYQVVVEYGFSMSATRKVALSENDDLLINKTFTTVIFSRIILTLLCIFITFIYIFINHNNIEQCLCLAILLLSIFGSCFQLNWLYQGKQQMQYITIVSVISRIVSVFLIFMLVQSSDDIFLYCLLYSSSYIINGILGIIIAKLIFHIRLVKIQFCDILGELKSGWYVFTTQLSSKVFGAIGITFLGIFGTTHEVGIYSAIQKIPNVMMLAWTPISQVLYPISSRRMRESYNEGKLFVKKIRKVVMPVFIFLALCVALFSKQIVKIAFGDAYMERFYWIIPLLAWLIVSIANNLTGIQTLLASGHDSEYSKCFQIGVVATILLNFVLIYLFKGNGACIAPLLSEIVLSFLLHCKIKEIG